MWGRVRERGHKTCPPLAGGPKSLISRRGLNRLDCFAFARNDVILLPRPFMGEGRGEGFIFSYDETCF